jgi:hypothetical protein
MRKGIYLFGLMLAVAVAWAQTPVPPRSPDTLPAQYTDAEFWKLVSDFSEAGGQFPYENFVSNERNYQVVLPEVIRQTRPGGVYLGVAPEQNFTYIAAIKPKVAFIFDIRRQNLVELLMYKALFELSPDRSEFLSRLFSRRLPTVAGATPSVAILLNAINNAKPDPQLYDQTLLVIRNNLTSQHRFALTPDDLEKIAYIFRVFYQGGPRMDYAYASASPNASVPSFHNLMIATDRQGKNWAFLANDENYGFVRTMQQKNLIVPVVGDFAGPKAIKAVGQYLKQHSAAVTVFYISNVEDYLSATWSAYRANLEALPVEPSGLFIRFAPQDTYLRPIKEVPIRWPGRNW